MYRNFSTFAVGQMAASAVGVAEALIEGGVEGHGHVDRLHGAVSRPQPILTHPSSSSSSKGCGGPAAGSSRPGPIDDFP